MITQSKVETIIKNYDLKEVDVNFKGNQLFALNTGKQLLGVTFESKIVEIFKILPDKKFIRIFRSGEDQINDHYDFKLVVDLITDDEEILFINKLIKKNKK